MSEEKAGKDKIIQHLEKMKAEHPTLYAAWQLFARFETNARTLKRRIGALRIAALFLGVFSPVLAILDEFYGDQTNILRSFIIVLPILLSALLTASNRLERGGKWFILRAAAEGVKREIYSFRVGIDKYADLPTKDEYLASRLEDLYRKLMETKVNSIGLKGYDEEDHDLPPKIQHFAKGDDGFSPITVEEYVRFRLDSQIKFYQSRVRKFHNNIRFWNFWIVLAGGIGTYLAATGQEIWIAVTTAAVSAFTGYMEYNQMEDTLISYNQALANLETIQIWWRAQDKEKQNMPTTRDLVVAKTEDVLNAELLRWIQTMESVLETEVGGGGDKDLPEVVEEEITDGTYIGPTDGPDFGNSDDLEAPRDLSPEELADISDELEVRYDLEDETDD